MIAVGLDEEAATLTFVRGIGKSWAKRLHANGIPDVEVLAQSEASDLAARVEGLGAERAGNWILGANALLCEKDAFTLREWKRANRQMRERPSLSWPADVNAYRLRRALELHIAPREGWFEVWGGTEPHQVRQGGASAELAQSAAWTCDCADFALTPERACKHILRARLFVGDKPLELLAARLSERGDDRPLDLYDLWFDGRAAK